MCSRSWQATRGGCSLRPVQGVARVFSLADIRALAYIPRDTTTPPPLKPWAKRLLSFHCVIKRKFIRRTYGPDSTTAKNCVRKRLAQKHAAIAGLMQGANNSYIRIRLDDQIASLDRFVELHGLEARHRRMATPARARRVVRADGAPAAKCGCGVTNGAARCLTCTCAKAEVPCSPACHNGQECTCRNPWNA